MLLRLILELVFDLIARYERMMEDAEDVWGEESD
jgi:hypothetical protein